MTSRRGFNWTRLCPRVTGVAYRRGKAEVVSMQYKPKSIAALQVALGGLPSTMHVETDRDIDLPAKTVGELRKVNTWPENLVITTPQERHSESAIRVSKATHATRVTPKS